MTCKTCGKTRRIPKILYAPRVVYEQDPYCSRDCCEKDHGITRAETYKAEKPKLTRRQIEAELADQAIRERIAAEKRASQEKVKEYYEEHPDDSRGYELKMIVRKCDRCQTEFQARTKLVKFCSRACYQHDKQTNRKTCPCCRRRFKPRKPSQTFCSVPCFEAA